MLMSKVWSQVNIASVDLETTHFDSQRRICEFAVVPIRNRSVYQSNAYVSTVNPGRAIHWGATKVHGLEIKDVKGKPSFRDKYTDLPRVFGREVYVLHNAGFDIRALKNEIPDFKPPIVLDTQRWATKIHGRGMSSLSKLTQHYRLHGQIQDHPYGRELKAHRAYYDAVATALLFLKFIQRHRMESASLKDLHKICGYNAS